MIVFSNYFKIVKKHLGIIILFSAISIGISIANTSYTNTDNYTNVEPKVSIINHDNSSITSSFIKYIKKNTKIIEIKNDKKSIQDALYTNKVDTVLIIPNNFEENLLLGNNPNIKIKKSAENYSEYIELLTNRYFKLVENYSKLGIPKKEIIKNVEQDLKKEVEVKISNKNKSNIEKLAVYYSLENYAFLSIFIFIIGTIMCIFNKETIKKRNNISKINQRSLSNQLFLGHITLTLSIWLIYIIISIILYKDLMFSINGLLLALNSLCFAISVTSLAYLIGCLINNQNVISGIQNVVSLGLSFISGCFVPVELLDKNIVNFSKIFPSYWYIKGNYDIVKLTTFNYNDILSIIKNYEIILIFGFLYFTISRIIVIKKTKKN